MGIILDGYHSGNSFSEIYTQLLSLWSSGSFTVWLSMLCALASLFLFGFWYRKKLAVHEERTVAKSAFNLWIVLSLFLLAIGLQYVVSYFMSFIGALRPDWMRSYEDLMNTVSDTGSISPVMAFYSCLVAPVSEELLFRGVTQGYAKKPCLPLAQSACRLFCSVFFI